MSFLQVRGEAFGGGTNMCDRTSCCLCTLCKYIETGGQEQYHVWWFCFFFPVLLPVFDEKLAKGFLFGLTLVALVVQGTGRFTRVLILTMFGNRSFVFLIGEGWKAFAADWARPVTLFHGELRYWCQHRLLPR